MSDISLNESDEVTIADSAGVNKLLVNTDGSLNVNATVVGTASATLTNVSASTSSVQLLAANTARKMATVYNDSGATLYIKFGTTASTTSFTVQLIKDTYYEFPSPVYTGRVDGIWSAASGTARLTEY